MDRQVTHTGALIPNATLLGGEKAKLVSLGYALESILGSSTTVSGLACTATTPASLSVVVGPGSITTKEAIDTAAFGDLGVDGNATVKQGILQEPGKTLVLTPPAAAGYSQVYLVQARRSDVDSGTVLPYYNAANPAQPFNGPANSGDEDLTLRASVCTIALKPGVAAPSGSQQPPSPDAGYVGLYLITLVNGQSQISSSNIALYPGAPFIPATLPGIPNAVQAGTWTYAEDFGTADNYAITLSPNNGAPAKPLRVFVKFANANASTNPVLNLNGTGNKALLKRDGTAPAVGDIPVGWRTIFYDGTAWRLEGAAASEGLSSSNALTIVKLAGSPFNYRNTNSSTRTNASAASAGQQVTVLSGQTYTKKSATSTLVIVANFTAYSPVIPGQGNGASSARLFVSNGSYADVSLNSVFLASNGAPSGSGGNSPTFVLPGIPAGALTFGISISRGDALSWNTIFNPYPSDFSTTGPTPYSFFFIYEFEPSS